jgi:hypothetical protein
MASGFFSKGQQNLRATKVAHRIKDASTLLLPELTSIRAGGWLCPLKHRCCWILACEVCLSSQNQLKILVLTLRYISARAYHKTVPDFVYGRHVEGTGVAGFVWQLSSSSMSIRRALLIPLENHHRVRDTNTTTNHKPSAGGFDTNL